MLTFVLAGVLLLGVGGASEAQQTAPAWPRLVTAPGRYHAHGGESVKLPCDVTNLGRKSVFWLKGDSSMESRELLVQIRGVRRRPVAVRRFLQDMRTGKMATDGTHLIINNLTEDDAGTYTCTVTWAGQSVTHVLEVTDLGSLQKVVMEYLPPSRSMTVVEGSPVTFACHARGSPQPSVAWYREGTEREVLREGPVLNIAEAGREDAGRYQCLTSSGEDGRRQGTVFTLNVEYVSVRGAQDRVVVRSEYPRAQLTCYVEGYPEPQVLWYQSSGQVTEDARHRFVADRHQHHLQIEDVTVADLGEYQCYVHNGASRDLATLTLTAAPREARILGAELTPRHSTYNLTWEVESITPLRLYMLEYRKGPAAGQWNTTYVGISDTPQGMTYVQSGLLTLDPASTYEVKVRGVTEDNEQGPDMINPFEIVTGGGTKEKISRFFHTALPILSRLPILARTLQ
ncbi:protein amalgam-like isoform X2 [Eriocheir sinensis]|uniref:protein amalgam-like isoform X2 n=1 Tax=Eriocheir sinensis TaxID=95602 RepID=UPI0021C7D718|nr:protein amalgam-like isoform X2 [Eriocheir sinensis]